MPNLVNTYLFNSEIRPPTTPPFSPLANFTSRDPLNTGVLPADLSNISTWTSTVNSYAMSWNSVGSPCTINYSGFNGFPKITYTGLGSLYNIPAPFGVDLTDNFTLFYYGKLNSGLYLGGFQCPFGATNRYAAFYFNGNVYLDHGDIFGQRVLGPNPFPVSNFSVLAGRAATTSLRVYQDNNIISTAFNIANVSLAGQSCTVMSDDPADYLQFVFYDRDLSDTEVSDVFDYFTTEWAP